MKRLLCLVLISFGSLQSQALEFKGIDFKTEGTILKFKDRSQIRSIEDKTGWITLRVLTLLTFQDLIEASYKDPAQSSRLLREEAPHLRRLAPCFHKTLQKMKNLNLTDNQKELVELNLESDIFNFEKNRRRSTEEVLTNKLHPLLSSETTIKTMTEILKGQRIEIPRHSLKPADSIAFELSASQIELPAKAKYRTKSRIDWDPSANICE